MISVDIVTPHRRLLEGIKVDVLKVPAHRGELMILPGHTELLTLLDTGILSFVQEGRERKFAVSFGFLDVRNDRAIVLAETCEESTEIDKERAKIAQRKAEEAIAAGLSEEQFRKYQLKLQRAITRQNLIH